MSVFDHRLPYEIKYKSGHPDPESFSFTEVSGLVLVQTLDRKELVMLGANFGDIIRFIRLRNGGLSRFTTAVVTDESQGFIIAIKGGGGFDIEVDESDEKKIRPIENPDDDWTGTRTG